MPLTPMPDFPNAFWLNAETTALVHRAAGTLDH